MILNVLFKMPDAVEEALKYAGFDEDEKKEMRAFANQWIKHGEYVMIRFDTNKDAPVVVPANRH